MKTALVFSAGGMFGAWQAGAWKALAGRFEPDLVVGASIGSLNGWAVAGGCTPEQLESAWLGLNGAGSLRFRMPRTALGGWFDTSHLEKTIRSFHGAYTPQRDYALIATELPRMKPRIFLGPEVRVEHLLASCAVPLVLDQQRIEGRVYSDGGLMAALPVWAAVELGATRIVALNALPRMPFAPIRLAAQALRGVSRWRAGTPVGVEVMHVAPEAPLGSVREIMEWKKDRVAAWIAQGEEDAKRQAGQNKTFLSAMF